MSQALDLLHRNVSDTLSRYVGGDHHFMLASSSDCSDPIPRIAL